MCKQTPAAAHSFCNIHEDTVHVNKQLFISTFILAVQTEPSWVKKPSEFTNNFKRHYKPLPNDVETFIS